MPTLVGPFYGTYFFGTLIGPLNGATVGDGVGVRERVSWGKRLVEGVKYFS